MNPPHRPPNEPDETDRLSSIPKHDPPRWAPLLAWLLFGVLLIVAVDQISKQWADTVLRTHESGSISLFNFFEFRSSLTFVTNSGAAWGLLSEIDSSIRRPFFIGMSLIAIAFILGLYWRLHPSQRLLAIALSLIFAGAIGNFIDRVRFDYVIDFIDLRYRELRWPTFNVADVSISCGLVFIFLEILRKRPTRMEAHSGAKNE